MYDSDQLQLLLTIIIIIIIITVSLVTGPFFLVCFLNQR